MHEVLLYSVALPLAITMGVLLASRWLFCRRQEERDLIEYPLSAASAIAFACAYLICHLGIHGKPASAQLEAWEWLLLLVPLATLLGVIGSCAAGKAWLEVPLAICLAALSGWLLVPSFVESPWPWRVGIAVTVLVLGSSQQSIVGKLSIAPVLVSWILIFSCGLPVLIASANAKFGFFSTSVAAAAGGALLVCLFRKLQDGWRGTGGIWVVSLLLVALLSSGYFNDYGDVPLAAFGLLIAAPLGLFVGVGVSRFQSRVWISAVVGVLSVVVCCGTSLYFVWPALTAEPAY